MPGTVTLALGLLDFAKDALNTYVHLEQLRSAGALSPEQEAEAVAEFRTRLKPTHDAWDAQIAAIKAKALAPPADGAHD